MQHLERAFDKQNQWWKYLVVFITGFFLASIVGSIPLFIVLANHGALTTEAIANPTKYGVPSNLALFLFLLPFVVGLITVSLQFRKLHKRSLTETINGTNSFRWGHFFRGAGIWGSLVVVSFLIDYAMNPGQFQFNFQASQFFPLLLISVLVIPLQTSFEEVMYRGYLAQGLAAWTKSRIVVLLIPSLLFGLSHYANPEVQEYGFWNAMPMYVMIGFILGLAALLDDGIEVSMGAHAIQNILGAVLVSFKSSVLQTNSLFYQASINPTKELILEIVFGILFILILGRIYNWKFSTLLSMVRPKPVQVERTSNEDNASVPIDPASI